MGEQHESKEWRKLSLRRIEVGRATGEPCCRCGQPVDYSLPKHHRLAPTSDHLNPLMAGGDLLPALQELGIAHRGCNARAGNQMRKSLASGGRMVGVGDRVVGVDPVGELDLLNGASEWRVPSGARAPRLFSPSHPRAVGSLGGEAVEWINERRAGVGLPPLRWAQEIIYRRGLEVDSAGELVWDDVIVTQPRRGGKTVLLGELAAWRMHQAERFGEVQFVAHVAKDLRLARATMVPFWVWAEGLGYPSPRKSNGQETLFASDGSQWGVFSQESGVGHGSGLRLIDEAAYLKPETKEEVLDPTGIGRAGSQTWLFGMAKDSCTPLVPEGRAEAVDPANNVMLAEWSAEPDADPEDWGVWESCAPFLDDRIERDFRKAFRRRPRGFRGNYLNQWPALKEASGGFAGWSECPRVSGGPVPGGVAAVECSRDRSSFVAVVATAGGVWCHRAGSLAALGPVLDGWAPLSVKVGASLVAEQSFAWPVEMAGTKELGFGTPVLAQQVRAGLVAHEHSGWVDEQVLGARLRVSDSRSVVSEGLSVSSVEVVRALAWAVWGLSVVGSAEGAQIW